MTNYRGMPPAFLDQVIESSSDGVLALDKGLRYVIWNSGMENFTGVKKDQALGKVCYEKFPFLIDIGEVELMKRALAGEFIKSDDHEFDVGGSKAYFETAYSPIYDEGNLVVGCLGIVRNITERKNKEKELQEATLRLKKANTQIEVNNNIVPVGVYRTDKEGKCTYVNSVWSNITGITIEQSWGNTNISVIHPDDKDRVINSWKEAVKSKSIFIAEYRFLRPDGKIIWVLCKSVAETDISGEVIGFVGALVDITEQKNIEQQFKELNSELERKNTRMQLALKASEVGVWELYIKDDRLLWDDKMMEIYDQDPITFSGNFQGWADKLHPEDMEKTKNEFLRCIEKFDKFDRDFRIIARDGSVRYIKTLATIFADENGQPYRVLGVNWDTTEKTLYQEKILESQKQAEEANQAKNLFLANMSHEVRTPLTAILGFSELMGLQPLSTVQESYLSRVVSNARQLQLLVEDMLDLSKIESGKYEPKKSKFDLNALINDVKSTLQFNADKKNCKVTIVSELTKPFEVNSDILRVKQVLLNLVGNAIKFSHNEEVKIIPSVNSDGTITVDVIDSGAGISREGQKILFQPFIQVHNTKIEDPVDSGTGLGLHICKIVSKMLSGSVQLIKSEVGVGSHFRFIFPRGLSIDAEISQVINKNVKSEKLKIIKKLEGLRVLLVEDLMDNQFLIDAHLSNHGAIVDIADCGLRGIDKAMSGQYDVVLMDLGLPDINGCVAAATLRERGFKKPIMAVTAHHYPQDIERAHKSGMNEFVTKPIDFTKLVSLLEPICH